MLDSITIPHSVTEIGSYAFYDCPGLTSITITDRFTTPASVTTIGDKAFYDCSRLSSINIPDSVTEIGEEAFWGCNSLTSITIGDSVTEIGRRAFQYCTSLKEVYCKPTTPPSIGSEVFDYNASERKIYVPNKSFGLYTSALNWSDYSSDLRRYIF